MDTPETGRIGKRGAVVIPAGLRRQFGLEEGAIVLMEAREEGVLIRSAVVVPIEIYSPERKAEFLLSNAVDAKDYAEAVREVRRWGLDPETIGTRADGSDSSVPSSAAPSSAS